MKPPKRVLLVEDDRDISESLEITLRMKNFEVATFFSGQGVCDYVRAQRPDIVIMDVMMPPPDGFEYAGQLKSDEQTKHIPVILLSARSQQAEIDQGFKVRRGPVFDQAAFERRTAANGGGVDGEIMTRILVVDDEPDIAESLEVMLVKKRPHGIDRLLRR